MEEIDFEKLKVIKTGGADIDFAPSRKIGRRVYDDEKFYTSVVDKFAASGKVSAKQYVALQTLAAKYLDCIPAEKLALLTEDQRNELDILRSEQLRKDQELAESTAKAAAIDYAGLFNAFSKVEFEAPVSKGRFTFDDKKFKTLNHNVIIEDIKKNLK